MRIASGIDFLHSKNKFWMYDESPGFSGKIVDVLTLRVQNRSLRETLKTAFFTINATSENQANRYMLQEKDLGLVLKSSAPGNRDAQTFRWEPGLLPLEGMSDQKNYGVFEAIPDELGSSDFSRRQV